MSSHRLASLLLLLLAPNVLLSQSPRGAAAALTLEEAIRLAASNNPTFLRSENAERIADAQVRTSYGALLPTSGLNFGANYQQGGSNVVQGTEIKGTDTYSTAYSVGVSYGIGLASFVSPGAAKSNRTAAIASVDAARAVLRGQVAQAYLNALQNRALAEVADTLLQTAQTQVTLAEAKFAAGGATLLDVRNAQVGFGQARVAAINAKTAAARGVIRLGQVIGVALSPDVALTSEFSTSLPPLAIDSLTRSAVESNPNILAARATEQSTARQLVVARAQYTPSLSLSSGYGRQAVDHATFPFAYTKRPYSVSFGLGVPLFNGFSREQSVEVARVAHDNAYLDIRDRSLQVSADVADATGSLFGAHDAAELQRENAVTARQVLEFAEERYRLGAASFLDISLARAQFAQAEIARVTALYDFHRAFATLEAAVGRPLR